MLAGVNYYNTNQQDLTLVDRVKEDFFLWESNTIQSHILEHVFPSTKSVISIKTNRLCS